MTFIASGGSFADFRYIALYNDTAANDELIGYWDHGSTVTLIVDQVYTVELNAVVLTLGVC